MSAENEFYRVGEMVEMIVRASPLMTPQDMKVFEAIMERAFDGVGRDDFEESYEYLDDES